jgi:hypothetical protein
MEDNPSKLGKIPQNPWFDGGFRLQKGILLITAFTLSLDMDGKVGAMGNPAGPCWTDFRWFLQHMLPRP